MRLNARALSAEAGDGHDPDPLPEEGCGGVVLIAEAFHDDHDDLIGLTCPKQHRFDYDKHRCPRCGSPAAPARWDIVRASSVLPFPEGKVFKSARCTSPDCDWEGPKGQAVMMLKEVRERLGRRVKGGA